MNTYSFLIIALLGSVINTHSQHRSGLTIRLDEVNSRYFNSRYESEIKEAFTIMNAVFNSSEFQDRLHSTSFPCINRCLVDGCDFDSNCQSNRGRVTGQEILDSIFTEQQVTLAVTLKRRSLIGSLGETCPGKYSTIAYLKNITNDMSDLPVSYAIAVNLCHEYLHHIGFCHIGESFETNDANIPNPEAFEKDITYRMGWEVYYIVSNWHKNGKRF